MPRAAIPKRGRMISHAGARKGYAAAPGYPYSVEPCITHIDRAIIRAYFRHLDGRPAFAQSRRAFQRLVRGRWSANNRPTSQLQTTPLPDDLEQKLSALAPGFQRVRAGSDVLLIEITTRAVIDVLPDIDTTI